MNIALVGTGKMGNAVASVATSRGHTVVAEFDINTPLTPSVDLSTFNDADVVVDFTAPDVAPENIAAYCRLDLTAVIGTTGWYDALPQVQSWVAESNAGILYAPNFSIGVALMVHLLKAGSIILDRLPEYDLYVHEIHHRQKVDSPSGTALLLANVLLEGISRKTYIAKETQHQRIDEEALHVASTRSGYVFGEHTVGFDSIYDQLTITHTAKTREGFAFGAVRAAEWLEGRRGLFTLDDVLADWIGDLSSPNT